MFRKLYLKIRLFLYSIKEYLNRIAVVLMLTTLFYLFINFFVFKEFIINKACEERANHKYNNAIILYNIAYSYYSFNHFSSINKNIYFELPYNISLCYLGENNKEKSADTMLKGITVIQKQYGIFSKETASFIRKYLIKYYLITNNQNLARREFNNLLVIYKTIGYDDVIIADLNRLNADLYYQQENYAEAMVFYKEAYNRIIKQKNIDYTTFAQIVNKLCDYEVKNNNIDRAIELYNDSILILEGAGNKYSGLTADMFIKLGNLYSQDEKAVKNAITCYEKAISIIKHLPSKNYLKQNLKIYLTTLKSLYTQDNQYQMAHEIELEITKQKRFSFLFN